MVRERVGDWKLSWRFALAGLVAGVLVIILASTGVTAGTFDGGQDRLFPAPVPDSKITLVAIDQLSADSLGGYPLISNAYHAQVINYLISLNPSVILFDIPLNTFTPPDPEDGSETCPENESQEPAFLQALRIADGITDPLETNGGQAKFGPHRIPLVGDQMMINFTRGTGPTCTYAQIFKGGCLHPELITNHIVV